RRLAELTRFYAALRLPASAIEASDQSIASYPSDSVWEERIVLLTNLGFSGPAREALAERESLNPEPQWWYLGTRAYLAECDGRLEQALELAEQALRIKDDVLWCLGLRASCRHKLGRREEAEEDSRQIWQRYDPAGVEDRALFGIIALRLGLIENSRQILETLIETPDDGPKAELYLGLADLREGRAAAGEERIRRGLAGATTPEIREFLDVDLPEALQTSGGALDAVGARLRAEIHERLAKPSEPYAAELSRVIADASAARCAQQAALLTLARCRLRDQDYLGALALHARLRGLSPEIPESELALGVNAVLAGLSSRVDEAFAARAPLGIVAPLTEALAFDLDVAAKHQLRWLLGRGLLLAGLGQEAAVHLQAVLASPACEGLENARARASLGYAAFVSAQKGVAKQELRLAIAKLREPGSSATASELGNVCRSYLDSVDRYWELDSLWAELASSPNESDDFRDDVAAARASLRVFLSEHFRLNARPAFPATVSPIIVSLASSLVPDDTSEASPVFASYIPAMRESLQRSTGVPVPAITLRPDEDALAGAYSLLLNEIPAASARLEPGWIYAQSSEAELMGLGVPTSAIHAAPAALGGAWIERDYAEKAAALGVKLLVDPLAFVVRHLERVLRANMDEIFRLSDAEELLGSLAQDEAGAKVLEGALPDAGSRRACARVLRSLVHERVPITNLLAIVAAFGEARTKTTDSRELLRAVRLAISRDLPGIHGPQSVDLPTALESDIQKGMNFEATPPFLALSPPTAHTLLTSLRDLLQSHRAPGHALVVKEAAVRPLVRRLVELEFPEVSVVSAEERLRASQDGGDRALSGGGS
ncbi:MAG: FHIPEP family type III secretion protein, partial [Myxococcales bacterium]